MSDLIRQPKVVVVSARLTEQEAVALDRLAQRWKVDRSRALRKLVLGSGDDEAVRAIEAASYVRPATLPKAWRYKLVQDFSAMIGIENLSFRRGAIISRDGMDPRLIQQLFDRGAMLEPLPD
jgi:hypothetical protein